MGAGSEILTQSKNYNLKLVEIPITVRYDIGGTSSKNPMSHGFGVLGWLISFISENRPLLFFGVAGRGGVHDYRVDIWCERAVCCSEVLSMIPISKPLLDEAEIKNVTEVLKSGMLASGEWVNNFENAFADYIGTKYAIATTSGTTALDIALKALDIKSGDEVIVPDFTFISTANAVLFQNARPIFADVNEETFNIDPEDVIEKISPKTKAIIGVHLFGHPFDVKVMQEICEDYNLFLVEDCAQAHGAEYKGQKVGSFGAVGCFSFYATKNMTTGEGGKQCRMFKQVFKSSA